MKFKIQNFIIVVLILFVSTILLGASVLDVRSYSQERKEYRKIKRDLKREQRLRNDIEGTIQISGAFALYPLMVRWAEEFNVLYPNIKIDISAGGTGKGITDALTGMVDLGMSSRDIYSSEIKKGAFTIAVARDAVLATVNSKNPLIKDILFHGLKKCNAIQLWSNTKGTTWGEILDIDSNIPAHRYIRSDACGAGETWAKWLGIMHQENIQGTAVFGDPGVASVVQKDRVAIGFNNLAYTYNIKTRRPYKDITVMPLDLNNNGRVDIGENFYSTADKLIDAVINGKYSMPPARDLYLVSKGKPSKEEVNLFIEFILSKGQQYAIETLFIPLSQTQVSEELNKLNDTF